MERIKKFREKFIFILTTLLITLGLMCKDRIEILLKSHSFELHQEFFYLIIVVSGAVLAEIGAHPVVDLILKSKRMRKLIAGSTFIEGFWFYTHKKTDNDQDSVFANNALAEMSYNPASKKLEMSVYRSAKGVAIFNSNSKTLNFDETDKSYLNHFTYFNHNYTSELDHGFAIGSYTANENNEIYRFQGSIYVTGDKGKRMVIFQQGNKIDDEIKQFKASYKGPISNWREEFLKTKEV